MGSSSKFDLEVCRNLGFVCACSGNLNDLSALFVLLEHGSHKLRELRSKKKLNTKLHSCPLLNLCFDVELGTFHTFHTYTVT